MALFLLVSRSLNAMVRSNVNCVRTIITDGQTGSGKTWSMRGCESDPGMMVLCIRDIFDWGRSTRSIPIYAESCLLRSL
jgi:hypothetical protein